VKVRLESYEIAMAATVGSRRQLSAILKGSKPRFAEQRAGQLHDNHIRAAMAECAVAKFLGVYWGGHVDTYTKLPDVAEYEIRYSTRSDLKVKNNDEGIVISVTGDPPDFIIAGWMHAEDAKQERYTNDFGNGGPAAYFVPHGSLNSIKDLR
jgi:hypothetical protein